MAVKHWLGCYLVTFANGSHAPIAHEPVYVDTMEATEYANIRAWEITGGDWGTNDAAGNMWFYGCTANFIANLENADVLEDGGGTKIADVAVGCVDVQNDWNQKGNWLAGAAPAIPAATDEIIFDGQSAANCTDNIGIGDTGGIAFDLLHIKSSFTGNIGAAGVPLHFGDDGITPPKVIIEGSGIYYIECSENAAGDADITYCIINNPDCTVYLTSQTNSGTETCTWATVRIFGGTVYIGNDGTNDVSTYIISLYISPRNDTASNVTVYIKKDCYKVNGATATNIYMANGTLTTDSMVGTFHVYGGTVNYGTDLGNLPETDMNITTLELIGGTFNWLPDDSGNDAYIANLFLHGGTLDASWATNNDRAKALGAGAGSDIYLFEGGTLNIANEQGNITIAAASQLWNFGGTLTTDRGSQIAVTYDQP